MRRVAVLLPLCALLAAPPAATEPLALRLLLPEPLLDAAVTERDGRDTLTIVVAEGPDSERVYVFDPEARRLEAVGEALPAGSPALAPDAAGRPWTALARYGEVELLPPAGGGVDGEPASFPLPRRAERAPWGLRLTSPRVHPLPPVAAAAGPPCLATEPEAHGRRRLQVLLLCPGREPEESWMLLPQSERVTEARVGRVGGAPVLAVLATPRLGLFVEQELRLFALAGSRNRMGAGPLLTARTSCPLWRGTELAFADADGDGADDLVVVCRTGLFDQELRLEVYRHRTGQGGAPFEERAWGGKVEGDFGRWHYGEDWTGDGLPDLLAGRDGRLELYAGETGGRPVAAKASRSFVPPGPLETHPEDDDGDRTEITVSTSGATGREIRSGPSLLAGDLDGDGRPELVIHHRRAEGGELLVVTP